MHAHAMLRPPARVRAREKCTLTYTAAAPEGGGPDDLLLLQRYASRRALLDVHQKAPEFFAFGRALLKADLVLEKTAEAYVELPPPLDAPGGYFAED